MRDPVRQAQPAFTRRRDNAPRLSTSRLVAACAVAACLGLGLAACSDDSTAPSDPGAPEWLFAFTASDVATFDRATSRLTVPTSHVVAFSDRPYRDTRTLHPAGFARLWQLASDDSFAVDPPNAVLTYREFEDGAGEPRTAVLELRDEATWDAAAGALVFGVDVIEADAPLPERVHDASVFVDGFDSCPLSEDDKEIITYVNEANFSGELFSLQYNQSYATEDGVGVPVGPFWLWMTCEERESPSYPPPDLELTLYLQDSTQTWTCDDMFDFDRLGPGCDAEGTCHFTMIASNRVTGVVYSETELQITVPAAPDTFTPDVNPATIPLCLS